MKHGCRSGIYTAWRFCTQFLSIDTIRGLRPKNTVKTENRFKIMALQHDEIVGREGKKIWIKIWWNYIWRTDACLRSVEIIACVNCWIKVSNSIKLVEIASRVDHTLSLCIWITLCRKWLFIYLIIYLYLYYISQA